MNKSGYSVSKLLKTLFQVKLHSLVQRYTQYEQKKIASLWDFNYRGCDTCFSYDL